MPGENLLHYNAVRMRLNGSGNLKMTLYSLDDVNSQELDPFVMASATNIQPTRICNFIEQRAQLEIYTDELNTYFKINRILVFAKELFSSYPD
jgi:hypothetical protein